MELSEIYYDPSNNAVLGVFGDKVHVRTGEDENPIVLIMSIELFQKTWMNWLIGKKRHCESYKEYCGVGGVTGIEEGKLITDSKIYLNIFDDDGDDGKVSRVKPIVIEVTKFSDYHDFEHG